ncbi:MAG: LuxR family transcriptional regulator [Sphingomonas sp.]|jgi:LuxR family quorum-sensing system transcriptional regulator CciR|uniref:LuxR family transcriptional regulator n=1 Tax=Sphingomonas sp. TaxID=28214 RepID=UPI003564586E
MGMRSTAQAFVARVTAVSSAGDLDDALRAITLDMGFQYYALSHHVDIIAAGGKAIRVHNYPDRWADYYDANALGVSDPVHRASHVTSVGFRWSHIPQMIPLTACDRKVLLLGSDQGIGDGYTIPANVPGEARGSCSFANEAGRPMPDRMLPLAQLTGAFAFEAARRLWSVRQFELEPAQTLTDRQRDCALWAARGKSDWETSRILGLSEETVARHIRQGCERYGVNKRTLLLIRALFDGTLTFTDIFRR